MNTKLFGVSKRIIRWKTGKEKYNRYAINKTEYNGWINLKIQEEKLKGNHWQISELGL